MTTANRPDSPGVWQRDGNPEIYRVYQGEHLWSHLLTGGVNQYPVDSLPTGNWRKLTPCGEAREAARAKFREWLGHELPFTAPKHHDIAADKAAETFAGVREATIAEHYAAQGVELAERCTCYLQEEDPPEDHDIARFGCVCGRCYNALAELESFARGERDGLRAELEAAQQQVVKLGRERDELQDRLNCLKGELTEREAASVADYVKRIADGQTPSKVIAEAVSEYKGFYHLSCEFRERDQRQLTATEEQLTALRTAAEDPICGDSVKAFIEYWRKGNRQYKLDEWDADNMRTELWRVAEWLQQLTAALTAKEPTDER